MRKWLRSWFAWRFSLTRLVIAVAFWAAFVGLNVCGPQYQIHGFERKGRLVVEYFGWPVAFRSGTRPWDATSDPLLEFMTRERLDENEWLPWTHQTYRLTGSNLYFILTRWAVVHRDRSEINIIDAVLDVVFAIAVLTLILFLHPRRKPPDKAPT